MDEKTLEELFERAEEIMTDEAEEIIASDVTGEGEAVLTLTAAIYQLGPYMLTKVFTSLNSKDELRLILKAISLVGNYTVKALEED